MADFKTQSGAAQAERSPALRALLRKMAPRFLREYRGIVLRMGPRAAWTYARLRLLDAIGLRSSHQQLVPSSSRSFLFVCFGNIMRSPMAAALMQQAIRQAGLEQQIEIASAGLHANPGREAHEWGIAAARGMGISLSEHRANLLTRKMVEHADCIFVMDFQNKAEMNALYPEARSKTYLLSAYADGPARHREIADPYLGDVETTKSCYQVLQTSIRNLMVSIVLPQSISEDGGKVGHNDDITPSGLGTHRQELEDQVK